MEEKENNETNNLTQNEAVCNYCRQSINENAKVCHHCGKYQRKYLNYIASSISAIMVLIAVVQLSESITKRIEAEQVLQKANAVFSNVSTKSNKALEKSLSVEQRLDAANMHINKAEKDFSEKYNSLNGKMLTLRNQTEAGLEILNKRNDLTALADKAIASGDREAFDELNRIRHTKYSTAASSEYNRVLTHYMTGSRIPDPAVVYRAKGLDFKPDQFDTDYLIKNLLEQDPNGINWTSRGVYAELLGYRKEKKAVQALVESIKKEKQLDVVVKSMASFSKLTGYPETGFLEYTKLLEWWNNNKTRIEKDLK